MSHLPRNGQYELFTYNGVTHCFDDLSLDCIKTPAGMFEWIRNQDPLLWHPLSDNPTSNTALYLMPELYVMWKLKWL